MKQQLVQLLQLSDVERKAYIEKEGDKLLEQMLQVIGSPDAELRDALNYRFFVETANVLLWSPSQFTTMALTVSSNDFLYKGLNEQNETNVFTRSFSALWLTALLQIDAQQRFLTDEQVKSVLKAAASYLEREHDYRGFTGENGWAHAGAHGADLAVAVIRHPLFELSYAPIILQGVKAAQWKDYVFVDDEDERIVAIFQALAQKDFPEDVLVEWVEQMFDRLSRHLYTEGYNASYYHARTNTMSLMKTLYFNLKFSHQYDKVRGTASIFIQRWAK